MNKILFDKIVTINPVTFPFVTLPEPEVVQVPDKGNACTLNVYVHVYVATIPF